MLRLLSSLILVLSFQVPAFAVQNFAVTREELAMMPPYCTAHYGHIFGLPRFEDSPLRNTIPDGCPATHHYCDGLKAMIRVDTNRAESGYWLSVAVQTFRSMVKRNDWSSCPLKAEAYVNLGRAVLRQSRRDGTSPAEGVESLMKALELKPDYLAAYYALSDFYIDGQDKKKALSVVEDGLRHVPKSEVLLRRFKELGGKTPPTPIIAEKTDSTEESNDSSKVHQHQAPAENATIPSSESGFSTLKKTTSEQDTSQKIGTPSNPWCRFCPPEE